MKTHHSLHALLAAFLWLTQPAGARGQEAKPIPLAATIFPLADIVRQVGGSGVQVLQILPSGASPHTFDLAPGQIRALQKTRLIFKIGVVDDWIDRVGESVPTAEIVSLQGHVRLRPLRGGDHGHGGHAPGGPPNKRFDPHYWLDAANGQAMARAVCARLSAVDPARATLYAENSRRFQDALRRADQEMKKACAALKNRKLIVFHDGWNYFAAAYGLQIVAVFQPDPGREPAPRDLQRLYAVARSHGIKAVFSEPQLPASSLEPMLQDLGLRLFILDPLGGGAAGDSYLRMLQRNVQSIIRADAL
jgi:zinc transport system substrate-binding protein/manganese/iron transport system substrate-binding protein